MILQNLDDADLGIIDTERLIRMLSVLSGDCNLEYQKVDDRIVSVMMKDKMPKLSLLLVIYIFQDQSKLKNNLSLN